MGIFRRRASTKQSDVADAGWQGLSPQEDGARLLAEVEAHMAPMTDEDRATAKAYWVVAGQMANEKSGKKKR